MSNSQRPHDFMREEYEEFLQLDRALRGKGLDLAGLHEILDHYAGNRTDGVSYVDYRLIPCGDSVEQVEISGGTWGAWLKIRMNILSECREFLVERLPLFDEQGIMHLTSLSGKSIARRPIWKLEIKEGNGKEAGETRKLLKERGLLPEKLRLEGITGRFVKALNFYLDRWLRYGYGEKPEVVTQAFLAAISSAVHSAFFSKYALSFIPLAETTNALSRLSQARCVTALPLRLHRRALMGDDPRDQVRLLLPEHRGIFCPVETPESKSIGLVLRLARGFKHDKDGGLEPRRRDSTGNASDILGYGACLLPFIHHTDPTRAMMGAKNLKQALELPEGEPPLVQTGHEAEVFGQAEEMKIGCNLLTGYMSWYGYNYEDGIVVSDAVVRRFATFRQETIGPFPCYGSEIPGNPGKRFSELDDNGMIPAGKKVRKGAILAALYEKEWNSQVNGFVLGAHPVRLVRVPSGVEGRIVEASFEPFNKSGVPLPSSRVTGRLWFKIKTSMPLAQGDKMMGRHGNKGVVTRILPEREMPYLVAGNQQELNGLKFKKDSKGKPHYHGEERPHVHLEILLNPLGVVGRKNLGQLLETHLGLVLKCRPDSWENLSGLARPFRKMTGKDFDMLSCLLEKTGVVDDKGKARVFWNKGEKTCKTEEPIVVGIQYITKLNHLAGDKYHVRSTGPRSTLTGHPVRGRSRDGGLKLGEMELWCLLERKAWNIIKELVSIHGDPGGSTSQLLDTYLKILGIVINFNKGATYKTFCITDEKIEKMCKGSKIVKPDELRPVFSRKAKSSRKTASIIAGKGYRQGKGLHIALVKGGLFDPELFGPWFSKQPLNEQENGEVSIMPTLGDLMSHKNAGLSGNDLKEERWAFIEFAVPVLHTFSQEDVGRQDKVSFMEKILVPPLRFRPVSWSGISTPVMDEINCRYNEILKANSMLSKLPNSGIDLKKLKELKESFGKLLNVYVARSNRESCFRKFDSWLYYRGAWCDVKDAVLKRVPSEMKAEAKEGLREWRLYNHAIFRPYRRLVQAVFELFDEIIDRLKGKKGLIRQYLCGIRTDYSGRAVIVPDPELPVGTVELPGEMVSTFCKAGTGTTQKKIKTADLRVLLNRPPSLLPSNILSFAVKNGGKSKVIRINPALCKGFGADFDGDQMSVFALHDEEARKEADLYFRPGSMPFHPADGTVLFSTNLDIALGFRLSGITNDDLKKTLEDMRTDEDREAHISEKVKEAFEKATVAGLSFGMFDLLKIKDELSKPEEESQMSAFDRLLEKGDTSTNPLLKLYASGAASKKAAISQMLVRLGKINLPHETDKQVDISECYASGLSSESFYTAAYMSRYAMMFKKLRTAYGGAMTRLMVHKGFNAMQKDICTEYGKDYLVCSPFDRISDRNLPAGLLSCHLIGERFTQLSMKVIHGTGHDKILDRFPWVARDIRSPKAGAYDLLAMLMLIYGKSYHVSHLETLVWILYGYQADMNFISGLALGDVKKHLAAEWRQGSSNYRINFLERLLCRMFDKED